MIFASCQLLLIICRAGNDYAVENMIFEALHKQESSSDNWN